jgi:ankyrin repeat protein
MADEISGSARVPESLPDHPDLDWLRKQAKRRLQELRRDNPSAKLAAAQLDLARRYGFPSWRALKAHVDSLAVDGQLFDAARNGDVRRLTALLDEHPEKLHARATPYEWTLLNAAAHNGHLAIVDELLTRGIDVNVREKGDNTYAMHWAAAAAHLDVVRRLADAGGDVVGEGDDHQGGVIGWATCWPGCDDDKHRAVAEFLVARGASHHIFSAIAMNLASEVRRIVAADPSALNRRQSRNENHRTPLHFAVLMKRPEMIALLLELGADPLAVDGSGQPVSVYASTPDDDRPVMERIRAMVAAELVSASRGNRPPQGGPLDLVALLALGEFDTAADLLRANPELIASDRGVLHLMAQRNDAAAVNWLLARGADVNGRWSSLGAEVPPLHLAAARGHADMVRLLLRAGADPTIRDSRHDGDAIGWAEYFKQPAIARLLRDDAANR